MSKDKSATADEWAAEEMPAVDVADPELREIALKIYLDLRRGTMKGYEAKAVAAKAFREARAFIEAASQMGDILAEPENDGLDDASAPNLPPEHPFNLKSRRFGNAATLAEYKRLSSPGNEDEMKKRLARWN